MDVRAAAAGPVEGLYGPTSLSWRFYREAVLLVGGMRALLLQLAHPQVAAGVAAHSDFARDPYRRAYRTFDLTYRVVFGDLDGALTVGRQIRRRHDAVRGTDGDGRAYHANDPRLLLWVHATLIDTAVQVHELVFGPMPPGDRERLIAENGVAAAVYGMPDDTLPATWSAFQAYVRGMLDGDALTVGDTARQLGRALLRPPPLLRALSAVSRHLTAGLLPPRLRADYGLPWPPSQQAMHARMVAFLRRGVPLLPDTVRYVPSWHDAQARLARHRGQPQPLDARLVRAAFHLGRWGYAAARAR